MIGMLFIFVLVMIGVLIFIYWIPKKLGYPKVGKYLAIILSFFLVLIILFGVFKDAFFTKNKARELLTEQHITLEDDFEILNNKTTSAMADDYHRFRLEISENDKDRVLSEIKSAKGFKGINDEKLTLNPFTSDFNASKIIQNSENVEMFVREYFRPDHEGGASIYIKIYIEKNDSKLIFEKFKNN